MPEKKDEFAELDEALEQDRARSAEIEAEADQFEAKRKPPTPDIDHASDGGVI